MRFVRIYHHQKDDPGARLRIEYDPGDTQVFCISDENVLPEKIDDVDAHHVETLATVEIDRPAARWLRDTLVELCKQLDAEEAAYQFDHSATGVAR